MLPKERFINALFCRETDILPIWDFINNPALYQDVLGIDTFFFSGRDAARLYREMGLDGAFIPTGGYNGLLQKQDVWTDDSHFSDEWGTSYTWQKGSWPLAFPTAYSIPTDEDWKNLKKPDPLADWRFENALEAVRENQRGPDKAVAIIGGIRGPLSTASLILGLTKLSFMVYDNPALLQEILNTACDFWIAAGLKLIETGVDAIVIVDDMGANNGTLLSPKTMRQMVLPLLNKEVQAIQKKGMPVFLHSCGNINSILPDIVGTGILGLNNIQHAAGMDIRAIKERYGKHLCLIGNVDSSGVMSFGTTQEVEEAVRECVTAASNGGGHILATDHSFHEGIPLENVYAFIKAGKKYGTKG